MGLGGAIQELSVGNAEFYNRIWGRFEVFGYQLLDLLSDFARPAALRRHFCVAEPGANPNCVLPGSTFAINGTGMYPALVTGVVIGGMPLTASQYSKGSDALLQVIAPNQPSEVPQPVVVQTALGLSNSNVTIEI